MITTIAVFLFILWLLITFSSYAIGWIYHGLLIASILMLFIAAVRTKRPVIDELMINNSLSKSEAKEVKRVMDRNRLNDQEAIALVNIRSGKSLISDHKLLQTEADRVRAVMVKNRLNEYEALALLSLRMKLHS
jgi:hypothetical protein